jgi:hypothetical protein
MPGGGGEGVSESATTGLRAAAARLEEQASTRARRRGPATMPEGGASGRLEARRVPSPNCDERPPETDIDLVVVHRISLPPRV